MSLIIEDIKGQTSVSYSKIISSFSLMSGAAILTFILGIATNKVVAIVTGTGGIAIIGLFRNLISIIVSILVVGTPTVIVQRISTAPSDEAIPEIVKSVFSFLIFQILMLMFAAVFFADFISDWLFSKNNGSAHLDEIRIVLVMAIGILFSQTMIALLNGKVKLKKVTTINIVTAFATLIMVYPLLKMGDVGLAMIVGSGSLIGACIGFIYVRQTYRQELSEFAFITNVRKLFSSLPVSGWLLIHPIIIAGTFLNIQVMVNRYYGIDALGLYNAVTMLEGTTIMLLMAAMKSYYLPSLGQFSNQSDKQVFVNKVMTLLVVCVFPCIIIMIFGAKYILWLLFSEAFVPAASLLAIQSIALLSQVFSWCFAVYLLHEGRYGLYLALDASWAMLLLAGMWYVASNNFPLIALAATYLIGSLFSLTLYLSVILGFYGRGMLDARNVIFGLFVLAMAMFSYFIDVNGSIQLRVLFVSAMSVCSYFAIRIILKKIT